MSIASEITRLQNAKANIKTAIEAKGVEIPSNATLDEYSDYVEEIPSGGGGTPETLDDLNNTLEQFYDYLDDIPNSYESLSTDNITLYTPNADFKKYIILKEGSTYKMYWTNYNIVDITGSNWARKIGLYVENDYLIYSTPTHKFYQYSVKASPTLDELLEEIQNPNASINDYTYKTNVTTISVSNVYATNMAIVQATTGAHKSEYKLSSNETIQVIQ